MTNSTAIKALTENVVKAEKELETAIAPHLQEWIALQVGVGYLHPKNAQREVRFCGLSEDGLSVLYEIPAWLDNWNEWEFGDEVRLPFAFLDDPTPFYAEAAETVRRLDEKAKQREERKLAREEADLEAQIARLRKRREGLDK